MAMGERIAQPEAHERIAQLEAHVAALLQGLDDAEDYMAHGPSCLADLSHDPTRNPPCTCGLVELGARLRALLDAPNLAALVQRERAKDAVIVAASAVVAADTYKHPMLSRADAVAAGVMELHTTVNALAALTERPTTEQTDG
jgi:hypothetical protein